MTLSNSLYDFYMTLYMTFYMTLYMTLYMTPYQASNCFAIKNQI